MANIKIDKIVNWIKTHKKETAYILGFLFVLKNVGILGAVISVAVFTLFHTEIMAYVSKFIS